jgi:hypothetical protein
MRYRVHTDLSLGGGKTIPRGTLSDLAQLRPEVCGILQAQGAISPVAGPPLTALGTAWTPRREKLLPAGIVDVDGLLNADPAALAKRLKVKVELVKQWQAEAESLLKI